MSENLHDLTQIALSCGDSLCVVAPAAGGSIARWTVGGQPMLRNAGKEMGDPRAAASFPLVPYSNRIAGGRFENNRQTFRLKPTWSDEPLPLHGIGMMRAWQVCWVTTDSLSMTLDHRGDAHWPFAFEAEQQIRVTDDGLLIAMSVTNLQSYAVPAAFGHHPYFDSLGASLRFEANQVWSNSAESLPTTARPPAGDFDFADGATVADRTADNSYTGWNGIATIAWVGRRYSLSIAASRSLPAVVLYIPVASDHFCFEPVPHLTDAINRPGCPAPMPMLGAGERFDAHISLKATPANP